MHLPKNGPWLSDLCQQQYQDNLDSYQDEKTLQDKLESPLVFNLVELRGLKKSG